MLIDQLERAVKRIRELENFDEPKVVFPDQEIKIVMDVVLRSYQIFGDYPQVSIMGGAEPGERLGIVIHNHKMNKRLDIDLFDSDSEDSDSGIVLSLFYQDSNVHSMMGIRDVSDPIVLEHWLRMVQTVFSG